MNRNEKIISWLKAKAEKAYQDNGIVIQLFILFLIFSFLCVVLPILSGITEFTELYYITNAESSNTGLFLAILALLIIELPKVFAISLVFIKWFSGNFDYIFLLLIIGLSAQSASIYLSMQGSKRVPAILSTPPKYEPPILVNIDSVKTVHDTLVAQKEAISAAFFKQYRKTDAVTGEERLSSIYNLDRRAKEQDIRTAEKQRQISLDKAEMFNIAAISAAKDKHILKIKRYKEKINVSSSRLWYWSIVIEALYFLSSLFVFWFLHKALETDNGTNKSVKATTKPKKQKSVKTDNGTVRIGVAHLGTNNGTERITDNCLNCNASILHKRKDAKYCDSGCRVNHFKAKNS